MGFIDQYRWDPHWDYFWGDATTGAGANPQLQFFENFPGHLINATYDESAATLSVHAVNIPLSISFNNILMLASFTGTSSGSGTAHFGLYSLNGSTLSLANSASRAYSITTNGISWLSMVTSATQNITPGAWYFAFNKVSEETSLNGLGDRWYGNSSINPANAIPGGFLMGRMTASTNAMPASIATSALDITGSDAIRQPYIIITA